jgi:hypothetical protein
MTSRPAIGTVCAYLAPMRSPPVHRLTIDTHEVFTHRAGSYLALFDLGTYTRYVSKEADGLDISAHLQRQTKALTILAWDVRQPISRLDLVVIPEDEPLERQIPSGRQPFASGWVRTFGRLALTGNELLETCARDAEFDLLHSAHAGRPRLFDVPPGTYMIQVFSGGDNVSDVVILRHYPFPPPRVAPVRLGGHAFLSEEEDGDPNASHKSPKVGLPPPI